jgi:hypothetical protein
MWIFVQKPWVEGQKIMFPIFSGAIAQVGEMGGGGWVVENKAKLGSISISIASWS